jgi:hypothetical protein
MQGSFNQVYALVQSGFTMMAPQNVNPVTPLVKVASEAFTKTASPATLTKKEYSIQLNVIAITTFMKIVGRLLACLVIIVVINVMDQKKLNAHSAPHLT